MIKRAGPVLGLLALLACSEPTGCNIDPTYLKECPPGGLCGDYHAVLSYAIIGFPAEAVDTLGPNGETWGRIAVGDTLRLRLVGHDVYLPPCMWLETVRDAHWKIVDRGPEGRWGDTAAARVADTTDGVALIVARAPGAFGVFAWADTIALGSKGFPADTVADALFACDGAGLWAAGVVRKVRVVAAGDTT